MEHQIKNAKYEGYLWQSNQNKPKMIEERESLSLTLTDGENPFVVEGLLWNPEENTSIQIRCVDGKYFVTTYKVKPEDLAGSITMASVTYLPHRLPGVKALKFLRQWEEVKDELCENMPTLQLKANIFVGFEK